MKYFSRGAVFFLALLCVYGAWAVFAVPAASFSREMVGSSDAGLYWSGMPVDFEINRACSGGGPDAGASPESCQGAVRNSFFTWAGPGCTFLRFNEPAITDNTTINPNDGTNLVLWQNTTWNYSASALAMTTTTYQVPSGVIVDADIEVNGRDYQWRVLSEVDKHYVDIQNTITHEAGHVIGLDHSSIKAAVMYPSATMGEISKRNLAQDDIDGVCTIYPNGQSSDGGISDGGGGGGGGGCSCSSVGLRP